MTSASYSFESNPSSWLDAKPSLRWITWFFFCLLPFSINGLSVNYLFVLTPVLWIANGKRLRFPKSDILLLALSFFSVVFVVAALYQFQFYSYFDRRLVSFLLFMSIFTLSLLRLTPSLVASFFWSLLLSSAFISISSLFVALQMGISDPATLKELIGSQRYGYIYLFSTFTGLLLLPKCAKTFQKVFLLSLSALSFVGMILTFSRASYVSFIGSLFFVLLINLSLAKISIKKIWNILYLLFAFSLIMFIIYALYPQFFAFIDQRLLVLLSSEALSGQLSDSSSSEGTRLIIWKLCLDFLASNPLTGTGFLGSWVLSDWSGSAHNELIDRALRTGVLGFLIYLIIMFLILKYLSSISVLLGAAFFGVLIYGLFHETFSQSQGAVLLAFLLAMHCSRNELKTGPCFTQA